MQLQFDGVFRDAESWVNGICLGNNKSGYMGVAYDITDFVRTDRENVLVVRVDATQYEGWFYAGVGSALPDYLQYYRIDLLKNLGVNACRGSHNPPTSELLDACDNPTVRYETYSNQEGWK